MSSWSDLETMVAVGRPQAGSARAKGGPANCGEVATTSWAPGTAPAARQGPGRRRRQRAALPSSGAPAQPPNSSRTEGSATGQPSPARRQVVASPPLDDLLPPA